jgi:hypothetical protein
MLDLVGDEGTIIEGPRYQCWRSIFVNIVGLLVHVVQ